MLNGRGELKNSFVIDVLNHFGRYPGRKYMPKILATLPLSAFKVGQQAWLLFIKHGFCLH